VLLSDDIDQHHRRFSDYTPVTRRIHIEFREMRRVFVKKEGDLLSRDAEATQTPKQWGTEEEKLSVFRRYSAKFPIKTRRKDRDG